MIAPRAALLAVLSAAAARAQVPNVVTSVVLGAHPRARALDGTPPRIWVARGTASGAGKFYIHLMGGAWCGSDASCADRAFNPSHCWVGSSLESCWVGQEPGNGVAGTNFSSPVDASLVPSILNARWAGGLFTADPATNGVSSGWTRVELQYGDGMSYSSDVDAPIDVVYNGEARQIYYRGRANLEAALDELTAHYGLGTATEVIVGGDSAGGLATFWHADAIAARLGPAGTRVFAVPDHGYFYATDPVKPYPSWTNELLWIAQAGNASARGGLNAACVAAVAAGGGDPNTCTFPEVVTPYITTPTFVVNSQFDPALDSISGGENGSNATNVQRMAARLNALLNATVLALPGNGAFVTSCHEHCGQWAQAQTAPFADFNVTIPDAGGASWTAVPAVAAWLASLRAPSPLQHAPGDGASAAAGGARRPGGPRTAHDDVLVARAAALRARLVAAGVPPARADELAMPAWLRARAPPAGGARAALGALAPALTAPGAFVWRQAPVYPCAKCCSGGQA